VDAVKDSAHRRDVLLTLDEQGSVICFADVLNLADDAERELLQAAHAGGEVSCIRAGVLLQGRHEASR
jgi:hypothetical protein